MRNRRIHRDPASRADPGRGAQEPRVPGLRQRRHRPGSRATASSGSPAPPASWPTSRPGWTCRTPPPSASATPAGPPTAGPPRRTPIPTAAPTARWWRCTTASSRTSWSCGPSSRPHGQTFCTETDTECFPVMVAQLMRATGTLPGGLHPGRGAHARHLRHRLPARRRARAHPGGPQRPAPGHRPGRRARTSSPPTSSPCCATPGG